MTCKYPTIGTDCMCATCIERYEVAKRLVDRGADLRDLHEHIRPWVLRVRNERSGVRSYGSGGVAPITDDDSGPWGENAVGEMEDYDDGTPTL